MNPKIVSAMGIELSPEELEKLDDNKGSAPSALISPHEIVEVNNPNMPSVYDIKKTQMEGEKQLEDVIHTSLSNYNELYSESKKVDPKYKARHVEIANGTLNIALDAIKTKLSTQQQKVQQRMKEAEFGMGGSAKNTLNINAKDVVFSGSREDVLKQLMNITEGSKELEGKATVIDETPKGEKQ